VSLSTPPDKPARKLRLQAGAFVSSFFHRVMLRRWLRAIRVLVLGIVFLLLLPYVLTPLYRVVDPVSTLMLWRWAKGARVERIVVPIDHVAPILSRSVLAAECFRSPRAPRNPAPRRLANVVGWTAGALGPDRAAAALRIAQQFVRKSDQRPRPPPRRQH